MRIVLNGSDADVPAEATVDDAVEAATARATAPPAAGRAASPAAAPRSGLAVAVDGEVVPRSAWAATHLAEGQRVEVLHAVQGGA
jgi:sulfur carrier protein